MSAGMLHEGHIPMNDAEEAAYEALKAEHGAALTSVTRRDPGESGPVVAHVGDAEYLIGEDGSVTAP